MLSDRFFLCVYIHIYVGVCTCVASRVSDSVEKNRCQLKSITDRIRLAQARVDKIKGSKKATKVTPLWKAALCMIHSKMTRSLMTIISPVSVC